jgi:RNA polymerase sigma-70 factor (ECF subfamily)
LDEVALIAALRGGEERAFEILVKRYHVSLVRIALTYVQDASIAEEVAQETWLTVLNGIDRFEGRSSLKSWIFAILINRAKTRGERERRHLAISPLAEGDEPEVPLERFLPPDDPRQPLGWAIPPRAWPEERVLARETIEKVRDAIAELPPLQQSVLGLRDVEGWSAEEVAAALEISAGNARVLLHRARSRLRLALEGYFEA